MKKDITNTQKQVTSLFVISETFFLNKENLLFFPGTDENEWMVKLKQGLRGILIGKLSFCQVDEKYGIAQGPFKCYIQFYCLKIHQKSNSLRKLRLEILLTSVLNLSLFYPFLD